LTSIYFFDPFTALYSPGIKPDASNGEISDMQQKLKNWGYLTADINGIYDIETINAVERYQKDKGLSVTGFADPETMKSMGFAKFVQAGTAYAQSDGTSDEQLLARAINGEARGEPYIGQVAVGAVILNRTRDARFPKTVAGVIYQPGAFTAVDDGQINVPLDPGSTVVKAARDALNGWDPTNGCVYYFNPATATSKWIWSRQIVTTIGKHNFAK
jgi:N-acetylmuramoyl-L-alanine amidase